MLQELEKEKYSFELSLFGLLCFFCFVIQVSVSKYDASV